MKTAFIFIIVSAYYVLCTIGENQTSITFKYNMCFTDSKHCVQVRCFQKHGDAPYKKSFPTEQYRISLMDQINRVRSQYAEAHRISNMKFTNWMKEFEALADTMGGMECFDLSAVRSVNNSYKILDFHAQIPLMDHTNILNKILHLQMENFIRQMLNSMEMMVWNLNEFGCGYSFNVRGFNLSMLLRCVLYNENRGQKIELKSNMICLDCERTSERCINLEHYRGLCVPNTFNETRLKSFVASEPIKVTCTNHWLWILVFAVTLAIVFIVFPVLYKILFASKEPQSTNYIIYGNAPSAPPMI